MSDTKVAGMYLSRAKIQMFESHPFYGHICTKLQFRFDSDVAASCTDGRNVWINPDRYVKLSKAEQVTVLAHEQLHCLDGHLWRRGKRDPFLSNVAQDIYIYHVLRSEGFAVLRDNESALSKVLANVAGGVYTLAGFAGKFWEQIYELIAPADPPQSSGSQGQDGDGDGQSQQGSGDTGKDGECGHCYRESKGQQGQDDNQQWREWIREAGTFAKLAGAKPGYWSQLVKAATPTVPFETRFQEAMKRGLGGEQSFDTFARRHIHAGLYLPSEVVEQMGETVGVVDSSGSETEEDIAYALGVFRAWREQHPCIFHFVECDTEVQLWQTYDEWDELPERFEVKGRGGTEFADPFRKVEERHIAPALLVYITDGFNHGGYAPEPGYPVIWVLAGRYNDEFHPPYGEVVRVREVQHA